MRPHPSKPASVAVTGLHGAGQNPQPGCGILRTLEGSGHQVTGLIYDPLESGAYDSTRLHSVWAMPHLAAGAGAWLHQLAIRHEAQPLDVLVPTLDAEIEMLLNHRAEFNVLGIRTLLPSLEAFERRAKERLPELCHSAGCAHPRTVVIKHQRELKEKAAEIGFPLLLKGKHYGCLRIETEALLHATVASLSFGFPMLLQQPISGEEYNVAGLADSKHRLAGSVAVRKCLRSPDGKGLAGVTVQDSELDRLTQSILQAVKWTGPFELELIKHSGAYYLIEINPRFPAWIGFAAEAGCNLPLEAVAMALDPARHRTLEPVPAGKVFLRHSVDLVADVSQLGALSAEGILRYQTNPPPFGTVRLRVKPQVNGGPGSRILKNFPRIRL